MKVLVAVASRHQATAEIGERIGDVLRDRLHSDDASWVVDVREVGTVNAVEDYDAVVLGSAVYLGRWLKPARHFARSHAGSLRRRPVWLFSSGPIGEHLEPRLEPADVTTASQLTEAREHHLFAGRLRPADLSASERAAVHLVHAEEGDFRDWDDVASWADRIADDLLGSRAGAG